MGHAYERRHQLAHHCGKLIYGVASSSGGFMYILVAGSGRSSQANIDALISDYLTANPKATLILPASPKGFSAEQGYAAQVFDRQNLDITVLLKSGVSYDFLPVRTNEEFVSKTANIIEESFKYLKKNKDQAFVLWNDDDPVSVQILEQSTKAEIPLLDLTNGLIEIPPRAGLAEEPEPSIPLDEQDIEDLEELVEDSILPFSQEQIEAMAKIFAQAFVKELRGMFN